MQALGRSKISLSPVSDWTMAVYKASVFGLSDAPDFTYNTEVELSGNAGCFFIDDTLVELIDCGKRYTLELEGGSELIIKFTHVAVASETDPCVAHFEVQ